MKYPDCKEKNKIYIPIYRGGITSPSTFNLGGIN